MKILDVSTVQGQTELCAILGGSEPLARTVLLVKQGKGYAAVLPVANETLEGVDNETLSVGLSPTFWRIILDGRKSSPWITQEEIKHALTESPITVSATPAKKGRNTHGR